MNSIFAVRIQKLFLAAVVLKVVFSFIGWYLQMPWSLGFWLPLAVMAAYITIGVKRQDRDVTDEKFADSCYYLGFIFTITSIILSLFDLPNIGDRIQDIAVRFGAAMVSTVAGLVVRVYLVSFRPDTSDALKDAEDAVLEAANKFREQLLMAYEKFGDFQAQVTKATESSVEGVNLQIEKLSKDYSLRMEQIFVELNDRNQKAVSSTLAEVQGASERMASAVDGYVDGMKSSLQTLGSKVDNFGEAVTSRLKTTTFPDDYFASQLAAPIEQLKAASTEVSEQVRAAATGAGEAVTLLSGAIRKLKSKTAQAEEALDTVVALTTAQQSLFDTSAKQLDELGQLGQVLSGVQSAMSASAAASASNWESNREVRGRVDAVVGAVEASQQAVVVALGQVAELLNAERGAANSLASQMQDSGVATLGLAQELRGVSAVVQQLADKMQTGESATDKLLGVAHSIVVQQQIVEKVLTSLKGRTDDLSRNVDTAVVRLISAASRIDNVFSANDAKALELSNLLPAAVTFPTSPGSSTLDPFDGGVANVPSNTANLTPAASYFSGPPAPSESSTRGGTGLG